MANIKTTPDEWRIAKELFEHGLSLSKIAGKTGITKSQLSKKSNKENWSKETGSFSKNELVQKDVEVRLAKETMDRIEVSVHNSLVDERIKHLSLITNATHINVNRMMKKFDRKSKEYQEDMTIMDNKLVQSTLRDARESLLGKEQPQTNVYNNQQVVQLTKDDLIDRANKANDYRSIIESSRTPD